MLISTSNSQLGVAPGDRLLEEVVIAVSPENEGGVEGSLDRRFIELEKKFSKKLDKIKDKVKTLKKEIKNTADGDEDDVGQKQPSKWASSALVVVWSTTTFLVMTYGEALLSPAGAALIIGICGKQLATVMKAALRTMPIVSYPLVSSGIVIGAVTGFGYSHQWGVNSFLLSLSSLLGVAERCQKLFILGKTEKLMKDCACAKVLCGRTVRCFKGMGNWVKQKIGCCCATREQVDSQSPSLCGRVTDCLSSMGGWVKRKLCGSSEEPKAISLVEV